MKLHGKPVKCKESEPYLGFTLHEQGVKTSISTTTKLRIDKAWGKCAAIKSIVNHPSIAQFGWLRACLTLFKSIIPPVLMYSCEVWAGCPRYIIDNLESNYKKILYAILEIPEKTKIAAVMLESGVSRLRHMINKRQILYVNHVMWDLKGTFVWASLMEEWKLKGDNSIIANVNKLAEMYELPAVSDQKLDKRHVKLTIKTFSDRELWTECFASKIIRTRPFLRIGGASHFGWLRNKARALFMWNVGALKFKCLWKLYNVKRGIGVGCLMPICSGNDNLEHVQQCPFY